MCCAFINSRYKRCSCLEITVWTLLRVMWSTKYVDAVRLVMIDAICQRHGSGGTKLVITGSGFREVSNLACRFDETVSIPGTFISETKIECTFPDLSNVDERFAEKVNVDVTLNGEDYSTNVLSVEHV